MVSNLQKMRLVYKPEIAKSLQNIHEAGFVEGALKESSKEIKEFFKELSFSKELVLRPAQKKQFEPLRIGVVLSGGQAAGGHNVIWGLFDALCELHPQSLLFGFLNGPHGIVKGKYQEITQGLIDEYRNQGGFDLIGSGRTKIETPEQFQEALKTVNTLQLDGLVVIGGDDSNTNACYLAEYFLQNRVKTKVVGVPKTIDGDLQNERVSISFGFDTACKIYSEAIGNIAKDALSAKKYYFFVKLMGRSASHITLECALQTGPNMALIGEEIEKNKLHLTQVVGAIADLVDARYQAKKEYGVVLIPEGVIEFIPDVKKLIKEINRLVAKETGSTIDSIISHLSSDVKDTFVLFPKSIQEQLLLDRDPHGNVQVSKIETERLFMALVDQELKKRNFQGKFSPVSIFCGYEGRSSLPSNFDANYCYNLGRLSALLIAHNKTGYMAALSPLQSTIADAGAYGVPLAPLLHMEERDGKQKAVMKKALVDLTSKVFLHFSKMRKKWEIEDHYQQPGPIQFFGPKELTDSIPRIIRDPV